MSKGLKENKRVLLIGAAAVILIVVLVIVVISQTTTSSRQKNAVDENTQIEAYIKDIELDDIKVIDGGITYVDSQLLLTAAIDATKKDIENLVKNYDASIVGYIGLTGDYQIEFNQPKSYEELCAIAKELENNALVEIADVHYLFETDADSYTEAVPIQLSASEWRDPWTATEPSVLVRNPDAIGFGSPALPSNYQWWAEAVNLPFAWQLTDGKLADINVGIIDSAFELAK